MQSTVALHCFQVLMQKTLLRGETVIFGKQVIDSLSVKVKAEGSGKRTRTSVRLAHWVEVMKEGLGKFRIGTFDSGANCDEKKNQPRIRLDLPSSDNPGAVIEFHNRLMRLCAMPYECLIQKIMRKQGKLARRGLLRLLQKRLWQKSCHCQPLEILDFKLADHMAGYGKDEKSLFAFASSRLLKTGSKLSI